ncbi:MAG: DUF3795 domain-containing protein [Candidatus Thorarchaeota archaeon]
MEMAYCGLDCEECPAFVARINNDNKLRVETQKKWDSPQYPVSIEDINCEGCKVENGIHFRWSSQCIVRACASQKGVETCAHCKDYICNTLSTWLMQAGDSARERLENIHAAL